MKRILIFSLDYYPNIGGAEVAVKEITDRISDISFDMITINRGNSAQEKIGNVNVYRIKCLTKFTFPFFAFVKAISLQKKNNYDATWSIMASYAGFASFLFKKRHSKIPFILNIQEGDNFERRKGIFHIPYTWIFKNADRIQVISNFLETWAREMKAKAPIIVIPNGVDVNRFSSVDRLEKKEGEVRLITTSRLVPKNATIDIIDSLQYLPSNIKLHILGQGYEEKMLKQRVEELKLQDRISFLGFVSQAELPHHLHSAHIFIRPSLSEGFGISFIEAMAAGIPVIANPVGGIVDFLKDGETGLFCEVGNPKSIAQKVSKLVKDKESRDYIVQNALKMVKERYDWSLIANDMKNKVFLKVL